MLKKICLFLFLPVVGNAQSLDVSVERADKGTGYTTFRIGQHRVDFSGSSILFTDSGARFGDYMAYGITPDYQLVGVLQNKVQGPQIWLTSTAGDTLASYSTISTSYDDPSLAVYPFNSGSLLLRNNIANFTYYSPAGLISSSGSGSSQSRGGESISEAAMDPGGKTILIYTPGIKRDNTIGSQAQILRENNAVEMIYESRNRQIAFGGVSADGQLLILITRRTGTEDRVIVMDRFGNELNTIRSNEELAAAYFTEDSKQILLHSSRRALVYSTLRGERIGSTSFRAPLIRAQYFPDDRMIVGITGSRVENTTIFKDLEFHAISLEKRAIARRELSGAIGTSPEIPLQFKRVGSGRYRLDGASKEISLRASF